jgi:ABC-type multidrug transport system permease subunit
MILHALVAAVVKDVRLLWRDKVGLVFLTIAPLIVMSVAGASLSTLFGGMPQGDARYVLPVVDEDGGHVAAALRDGLDAEAGIEIREVGSRDEALDLVRSRTSGAALVIPEGTARALSRNQRASLLLFTDPVKFVEVANVRLTVQELRHRLGQEALDRARRRLERVRERAVAGQRRIERRVERLRASLEKSSGQARELSKELARRVEAARSRLEKELRSAVDTAMSDQTAAARTRAEHEIAPLRAFLDALAAYRVQFEAWLGKAREQAGSYADRIPPPPEPPALPPGLDDLAHGDARAIAGRIVGDRIELDPGDLPRIDLRLPSLPPTPEIVAPRLQPLPAIRLPRLPDIEETSVSGAPQRLNSFDQYVPGFSITFLMLGMLLGIAMTLIDEIELGTLERVRATPAPVATLVIGKLLVRFVVGVLQMIALLAVGRFAFGVSLGPQPVALLLPTAGIVFVGTAFGVLVAGLAPTRDAVLPLGAIAIVTMCAVGGCWWPIDLEPRWMRDVSRAFPTTWAMTGFKDLMMRRQGIAAAIEPATILFGFGLAFLAAGLMLFRRRR